MKNFEKGKSLYKKTYSCGKLLKIFTKIMIGVTAFLFIGSCIEFFLLKAGFRESVVEADMGLMDVFYAIQGVVGILYIVGLILVGITFLVWFYLNYKSLRLLGVKTRYRPWVSVFGWIVPLWNFIGPFYVMQDICNGNVVIKKGDVTLFSKEKAKYYLVQIWWILWIAAFLLTRYVESDTFGYETVAERINNNWIMSLSLILDIFENILFLKILIWVAKLQKEVISKNQLNTLSQGKIDN